MLNPSRVPVARLTFRSLTRRALPAVLAGACALVPSAASACASCGCTLSSDAAFGYSSTAGWRLSVQYDYLNQDTLRSGTHTASVADVVNAPSNPALGGGEIEHGTLNRYLTLGLTYSPNANWHFDLRLPYIDRDHSTYGQQQSPYVPADTAPDQLSVAHVAGLGDIKLLASYQGFLPTHNLGVQLGLKLPTGAYGSANLFRSGPGAGTPLDNSLQAGTGSTDLVLGGYYHQAISQDFDAFVNGQFQSAISHAPNTPGSDFRPGNSLTASVGLRYANHPGLSPSLQVNLLRRLADTGALADTTNTAGTIAYVSPGLTARLAPRLSAYGFVQVPLYSNLSGYQLFPRWTGSLGLSVGW